MENIHIIIPVAAALLSILIAIFPNIPRKLKVAIILCVIVIGSAFSYFNTNHYKHWKYYKESNIEVICKQFPPMIVDNNNFYYRYIALIQNKYAETIKIENFQMKFQSSLSINDYKTIFSDIQNTLLTISAEEASILSVRTAEFKGGQAFSISMDCSLPRRSLLENRAATINITYTLFGKTHSKSFFVNPMEVMDLRMPKKEAVVFDLFKVLDNRSLPESFFSYHYSKVISESGDKSLEVYCWDNKSKLLKIQYTNPSGVITLESEKPIHNDFDPIRILVLANDDILVYSWLGKFRKQEAAKQFRLGMELSQKGDYKGGAEAFKKVTELDPNDAEAYSSWGVALGEQGNHKDAAEKFSKAIDLKPDYAEAYYNWGVALVGQGSYGEAIEKTKEAIDLRPDYAKAYLNWGIALGQLGTYEGAIEKFSKAIDLKPDYAEAYYNWGVALGKQDNYKDAAEKYKKTIDLKPDYAKAYLNWGGALVEQGRYEKAIEKYKKAIDLKPDYAKAYYNLASVYSIRKNVGTCCEYLKKAFSLDSNLETIAKADTNFNNVKDTKCFIELTKH